MPIPMPGHGGRRPRRSSVPAALATLAMLAACVAVPSLPPDLEISGDAGAVTCAEGESQALRSLDSFDDATVTVANETPLRVRLVWLDYDGQPRGYQSVGPWQTMSQRTYVSHAWLLTATRFGCVGGFVAGGPSARVTLSVPPAD